VAASEVAVGLALIIYVRRRTGTVNADDYTMLKG
jgi:NADH:ubiquinone oxidoreductase subunit K